MTFYTEYRAPQDDFYIDKHAIEQLQSVVKVGEIKSGEDIVVIYKIGP